MRPIERPICQRHLPLDEGQRGSRHRQIGKRSVEEISRRSSKYSTNSRTVRELHLTYFSFDVIVKP